MQYEWLIKYSKLIRGYAIAKDNGSNFSGIKEDVVLGINAAKGITEIPDISIGIDSAGKFMSV